MVGGELSYSRVSESHRSCAAPSIILFVQLIFTQTYSASVASRMALYKFDYYYRAMHFSAKRGIAIACRLSVRLSVCNVGEL